MSADKLRLMRITFWRWLYKKSRGKYRKYNTEMFVHRAEQLKKDGFTISLHAILRYFERVEGYNMAEVTKRLTEGLADKVLESGDGKYVLNGVRVTVVKRTIVTVDTGIKNQRRIVANPIKGMKEWLDTTQAGLQGEKQ